MRLITLFLSFFKKKEVPEADLYNLFVDEIYKVRNGAEADNIVRLIEERIKNPHQQARLKALLLVVAANKKIREIKNLIIQLN